MIGAFTGSLLNGIAVFREIVFYNRFQKKWAAHPFWLYFFIVVMALAPLLTWEGSISLFPALGSVCAVITFYMKKPTHIRIAGLAMTILWMVYCIFTQNIGGIIQNVINIVSIFMALTRDYITFTRNKKEGEKVKKSE